MQDINTVLIVDDNPVNLEVLTETLVNGGYQVAVATDGESALEQIKYCRPALILLDVMMPGIDGFETCRRLKENPTSHNIPIIFMTAVTDIESKIKGFSLGAVDYITKPFQGDEVIARVKVQISLQNLTQTLEQQNHLLKNEVRQREATELLLRQAKEEADRGNQAKSDFLANMSHELRTPLNAILGMTESLQEEIFGPVNDQQLRALQIIDRSSAHLLGLINDVLDIAKIEAGQMQLQHSWVTVTELCNASVAFIQQQALQKQIHVETTQAPNLPPLWIDERRMRQVLINLLHNAVKFTPDGGQVRFNASMVDESPVPRGQSFLRIVITDTGIGIAAESIDQLFQPFTQIDSALNRQHQGTGLGLALVKQIVELHGGQVTLTSEVGVGSCFTIDLPCRTATQTTPSQQRQEKKQSVTSSQATVKPFILLAEDNDANIATISSYLEAKGYRLLVALNGIEAVRLALSENPDLILMDIQMPQMDGLEAIRSIRSNPQFLDKPIIALTALAMTGDRERCLAAGASEYLAKPINLKQLINVIETLLN
ncbi:MAG TPA: response regulator [Stenomitos sp.]